MKVRFLNGGQVRKNSAAIMAQALIEKHKIVCNHPFVTFEVDDWSDFLRIVWHAYSDFSRNNELKWLENKLHVEVTLDDGREFSTFVWLDKEYQGIRYVSLY